MSLILHVLGILTLAGGVPAAACDHPRPDDRIRQLQRERVDSLTEGVTRQARRLPALRDEVLARYLDLVRELGDAELDLAGDRQAELDTLERTVRRLREAEDALAKGARADLGDSSRDAAQQVRAARLRAEIRLEKQKAER